MRTETLSIVFTDIKGYTATTSGQTHQENARLLKRVERIVAPVIRAYNGRVIKTIGDAYMIVFRSPTEGILCSAAIQDRLHLHNQSHSQNGQGTMPIHIRIAMNMGEVRVHRGDVFGEPVNIAARVEGVCPADEIYLSQAVYLNMNRSEVATEKVGAFELKGIPEPVTVYRVKKHTDVESDAEDSAEPSAPQGSMPYGGVQLAHWRRIRWVRAVHVAIKALAVVGLVGAAYVRYSPATDYGQDVAQAREAVEREDPLTALAAIGKIPADAFEEQATALPYRRRAISQLIEAGNLAPASEELGRILTDDKRDAEALLLKGALEIKEGNARGAMKTFEQALKTDAALAKRPVLVAHVVRAYLDPPARNRADALVHGYLKESAISAMLRTLERDEMDRIARHTLAARLDQLGSGADVDWTDILIRDLASSSCKVRKSASLRLAEVGDERAVPPLQKIIEAKDSCASSSAQKALEIMAER